MITMENVLLARSMDFAIEIVELTRRLREEKEFIISSQLGRSGTSIGANIREANYAQSRSDFISKLQIALKEASETGYWLELLYRTNSIPKQEYDRLEVICTELIKLLTASINTAKRS